jgi:hypothetical protein
VQEEEGGEIIRAVGKAGLFDPLLQFFRGLLKIGGKDAAESAGKDAESDFAKELTTKSMEPGLAEWDRQRGVTYLTDAERNELKLSVGKDGKLYDANGNLFDTSGGTTHWSGQGRAIFVMDGQGNIYASNTQVVGAFHHSSFLAGGDVAGAGELQVSNGELTLISNNSGHYRPPSSLNQQVLSVLAAQGVDTSAVATHWIPGT